MSRRELRLPAPPQPRTLRLVPRPPHRLRSPRALPLALAQLPAVLL